MPWKNVYGEEFESGDDSPAVEDEAAAGGFSILSAEGDDISRSHITAKKLKDETYFKDDGATASGSDIPSDELTAIIDKPSSSLKTGDKLTFDPLCEDGALYKSNQKVGFFKPPFIKKLQAKEQKPKSVTVKSVDGGMTIVTVKY